MQVSVARFQRLTRIVVFAARLQRQTFFRLRHQLFTRTKNHRARRAHFYAARQTAFIETFHTFLVAQLALMQRTKRVVVVVLRHVVWAGDHAVTAAGAHIFVVMDNAGFRIFFQRRDRAHRDTVRIDAVHTLFLNVRVAILLLVFVDPCAAGPHLNDVIGIRRQFVVVRPGLFPLRVTFRGVDILTLGDASLTAYAQGRVVQHPQRSRNWRAVFSSRMTDRRQRARQQCPAGGCFNKITSVHGYSPRESALSFFC